MDTTKTFDIFFKDLNPEAQKELLNTLSIKESDMNWDLIPLATLTVTTVDVEDDASSENE